ncbi:hypothetical protein LRR18_12215 [Mangrovimonas sp. AS39]|uniref:hypothetical protein n=1 Tax=Mangrovimonas futianensis TaxID=2895523 RepID=UPI001E3E520C|nr:hypothetical protein [Mangrovimonas futianensis]MCF1192350.1 hypothetical protein [Mangrovimonas futianensis]MCF1195901.1 hypothetical protein [Mangrovimonas futianensis]
MRKVRLLILCLFLFTALQSCSQEYPEDLKTGTFKTTTELNTVKYMYRNLDYRYIYSEDHPGGNKLAKITWKNSGYILETINKTSAYDSLTQTILLDEYKDNDSFTETTLTDGIGLKFTSKWIRIDESPNEKLKEVLEANGIKLK